MLDGQHEIHCLYTHAVSGGTLRKCCY